jgi:poly(A) polymerase
MNINPWKLLEQYPDPLIQALTELLQDRSGSCYISGGTVRDWFLGLKPKDLDLTVAKNSFDWAGELAAKLGGTFIPMNADEDVARVVWRGTCIDFSSFREGAQTIVEDLLKRDFTINSLAVRFPAQVPDSLDDVGHPEIIDPAGGRDDLQQKVIRSTSAAVFISDPVRLLRAFRFMATFGFSLSSRTEKQIQEHVHLLFLAAEERLAFELDSIMAVSESIATVKAMHRIGILEELVPELYRGVGVQQPASHHLDVFEHGIATLGQMEKVQQTPSKYFQESGDILCEYLQGGRRKILLKWTALFHDLGKPETFEIREDRDGRITFYNHDKEGARLFGIIAERFKWSRDDRDFVASLISVHMWPFHLNNARKKTGVTSRAYLRLIKAVGEEYPGLFMLAMADSLAGKGSGKPPRMEEEIAVLFLETERQYRRTIKPVLSKRLLSGHDLITYFKLEPGPIFRKIFDGLESAQVEGEVLDREQALDWVINYLKSHK